MSKRKTAWQHSILSVWQSKGLPSTLLLPLSWLYGAAVRMRRRRHERRAQEADFPRPPIVVVGNLVVGGTGKTPTVIALAQALQAQGWRPGIVSRGYGVRVGPQPRVGQGPVEAAQFGDEPALIAQATGCPIAVHPKRVLALQALLRQHPGIDVVIADDGLQHLALPRDLIVIVQDARGIGNGRLLPAGPLREPASRLRDAHTVITNLTAQTEPQPPVPDSAQALPDSPAASPRRPAAGSAAPGATRQVVMRLTPVGLTQLAGGRRMGWAAWRDAHAGWRVAALAAIGQPERFFRMLAQHGLALVYERALPDHQALDEDALQGLQADAVLVTEKDAVKLPDCQDARLWSVQVQPVFSDPDWALEISRALRTLPQAGAPPGGPGQR